jgi:hypothetical protein
MKKGRGLSQSFMDALRNNTGPGLSPLLQSVLEDETLCLEIRENYINIYYRGGSLIRLVEHKGKYVASFDRKYIVNPDQSRLPTQIDKHELTNPQEVRIWVDCIPWIKHEMDHWFHVHPKDEREFQQLMVRENNFSGTAKGTDFFICDIEYTNTCGRFDLIAVEWPSSSESRKKNTDLNLAFIEMKYMNKAMSNSSGIYSHICDMERYFRQTENEFAWIKKEMKTVFNQKLELGVIVNQKPIGSFNNNLPDFILAFANHDPDSKILIAELQNIREIISSLPFKLKFAVSNFLGYGLYKQNIFDYESFMDRFAFQIYSKPCL